MSKSIKERKVWVVQDYPSTDVFDKEEDARNHWLNRLDYYKHHEPCDKPTDLHTYDVISVSDEDDSHFFLVETTDVCGGKRIFWAAYFEKTIK